MVSTTPVFRNLWDLSLRYGCFALLATVANLGAQRLVLALWEGQGGFALALLFGGLVGLGVKYYLDKRWIFYDLDQSGFRQETRQFSLYVVMGIATTLIFWGTETAFWMIWGTHLMREIGAVLGLSVGYVIKYQLDRRFVFRQSGLLG